jgi:hypothetical protein
MGLRSYLRILKRLEPNYCPFISHVSLFR